MKVEGVVVTKEALKKKQKEYGIVKKVKQKHMYFGGSSKGFWGSKECKYGNK